MTPAAVPQSLPELLGEVERYYSAKLSKHGATPLGVDWNGDASQKLRFEQLEKLVAPGAPFSANDIGCGYGAMFEFAKERHSDVDYYGCDISEDMVEAARQRFGGDPRASFAIGSRPTVVADYGFASGIFNVRFDRTDDEWEAYITTTLDAISETSRLGFAFNCLTSYSDSNKMRSDLYYASPTAMFDLCKRRYSRHVALLHDYGLYEFTVIIRKNI
ncbi:methyltransferase [Mesorhizobium sp. A623]